MAFITDKQTMDDLGIFDKPGVEGIYSLFNLTRTPGGAALLEEMFQYPLSDVAAINERIWIIQRLTEKKIIFPFNPEHFGLIEHYLSHTDERTRLSPADRGVAKKLMNMIHADADYQLFQKGVVALKDILSGLSDFIQKGALDDLFIPWKNELIAALGNTDLKQVIESRKNSLGYSEIATFDGLLRFKHRGMLRQVLHFIYLLDVYIAIAGVATTRNFCFPKIAAGSKFLLQSRGLYHPQVKSAVANSVNATTDQNIIFLTGANMAGKSTLMKSIGVGIYLAHLGFPLPAESFEFAVMDGLFTTINLPDNLSSGTSHFYAEVVRIKKVAKHIAASKKLVIIFDELFRGTNVKDAYEATVELVTAFSKRSSSFFIVSTHIIEAGDVLKETCNNIQFLFMPTKMNGTVPVYTYVVEQGITEDRHGMVIIRNEGILEMLS